MQINEQGLMLIKIFEGCRLKAYRDAVGIMTIGYGWTHRINGEAIREGMIITQQKAEELLSEGIKPFEQAVSKWVNVPLNQNQFNALVSFTYNLGESQLANSSLLKILNQGNYQAAAEQFPLWCKAGGRILPGLVKRRAAEKEIFLS